MVYREVLVQNEVTETSAGMSSTVTVSIDEKPGDQAIEKYSPRLAPVPGKHPAVTGTMKTSAIAHFQY